MCVLPKVLSFHLPWSSILFVHIARFPFQRRQVLLILISSLFFVRGVGTRMFFSLAVLCRGGKGVCVISLSVRVSPPRRLPHSAREFQHARRKRNPEVVFAIARKKVCNRTSPLKRHEWVDRARMHIGRTFFSDSIYVKWGIDVVRKERMVWALRNSDIHSIHRILREFSNTTKGPSCIYSLDIFEFVFVLEFASTRSHSLFKFQIQTVGV